MGWWTGFPYLQTVLVIILGGILGVTYSIPLRRALVTNSELPYPEGVAGAEVLRVGDTSEGAEESRRGLGIIVRGSIASAALYFLNALKAISVDISGVFRVVRAHHDGHLRCPWPWPAWATWSHRRRHRR